jgi:hypothetical protein
MEYLFYFERSQNRSVEGITGYGTGVACEKKALKKGKK